MEKREKILIGCSGAKHVIGKISKKFKIKKSELLVEKFPDNELNIKFKDDLKNKEVILVQSFYGNLNEKIIETLFAVYTAKDLGAKKVILFSLYFPYFRKDKRFEKGECISIKVLSELVKVFSKIYIIDPHLHRIKKIKDVMKNGEKITSIDLIAEYFEKKFKSKKSTGVMFIGPDKESYQWAKEISQKTNFGSLILKKKRYGSKKVKIFLPKKISVKNKEVVIVDDIISTGNTMLETIKQLKKFKPKKIYCVAIHGIFADKEILKRLKKNSEIITTNTIPNKESKIDVSKLFEKIK